MSTNKQAQLSVAHEHPFKIVDAPIPTPEPHEVVIRNRAVSVNPVETEQQKMGILIERYPHVVGIDGAGEIVAVGSDVSAPFKVGDRVVAAFNHVLTHKITNGSYQQYACTDAKFVAKIPDSLSFIEATVLPLGLLTAGQALYGKNCLALPPPKPEVLANGTPSLSKVVLVWGGASSVGTCAIQLARASGFAVAATAGGKNQDYLKEVGATWAFDYSSPNVEDDIYEALKDASEVHIFDSISRLDGLPQLFKTNETVPIVARLATRLTGCNDFVQLVLPPNFRVSKERVPEDVRIGYTLVGEDQLAEFIWGDAFVAPALANGALKCKPDPYVASRGIENIQVAVDSYGTPQPRPTKIVAEI